MFHLALTLGREKNVPKAIVAMVRVVEATAKENGVEEALWMTLGISDGKNLWGLRYDSDGSGPTLYISPSIEEINRVSPQVAKKPGAFVAASFPSRSVTTRTVGNRFPRTRRFSSVRRALALVISTSKSESLG